MSERVWAQSELFAVETQDIITFRKQESSSKVNTLKGLQPMEASTIAEEESKKEGDTEEKNEEQRVAIPYQSDLEQQWGRWYWNEVLPGKGWGKVFSLIILCLSSLFLTTQIRN